MAIFTETETLIKYFNEKTGKRFKFGNAENSSIIEQCLSMNSDLPKAYKFVQEWISEGHDIISNDCLINCFRDYAMALTEEAKEIPAQSPEVTPDATFGAMNLLSQVVTDLVAKTAVDKVEEAVKSSLTTFVDDYIKKTYGPITRKMALEFKNPELKTPENEIIHEKFPEIMSCVMKDEPVYLVGPAGSGKNHLCKQIAETLQLEFYFSNAITQEYKLTGFTDATGVYQESQFYKAFTKGGLFMLDEMDASIPEVLIILNAAIANRYFDFPAPIGKVYAHKNFRVIAAGNTYGYGADNQYVGRNQLDAASLDRFAVVKMDYSPSIENEMCPDVEMLNFLRDYRKYSLKNGIQTIVSYRAMNRMFNLSEVLKPEELVDTCLVKGLAKDDVKHIFESFEYTNKWTKALKAVYNNLAA